ncbi:MAG: LysR family transcriptional regulator [Pseudomonadota bacterium]
MEMHQVRYFLALTEALNFTRAAERCNVSQPTLTRAMKQLEEELGGALFNRERNNTHLTELGRRTEPHLRTIAEQADAVRREAFGVQMLEATTLTIGAARGTALRHLVPALERFAERHPGVDVVLLEDGPDAVADALFEGELELAVLVDDVRRGGDFHYHGLGADRPHVLVRQDHAFAALDAVSLDDLVGEATIIRAGCAAGDAVAAGLAARGEAWRPRILTDAADWMQVLVDAGFGHGITGGHAEVTPGLLLKPLVDVDTEHRPCLTTRRGRRYSPAVRAFVQVAVTA